ncbi:transient receptor potential cation channel subfamily V member 1-like [Stegastes partitus]|uniref:Transient receptor potential cation channel subfamily V member 1-like n=1 Tax=Stegastes partitus TaxID=144197 RepID=A0A9Y4JHY6_9TELE|nr:PREDICTED: transient receptor potential cation channel subfamily V member 1-like [Stegastes partitus]
MPSAAIQLQDMEESSRRLLPQPREIPLVPMDTNVLTARPENVDSHALIRDRVFKAVSQGDAEGLNGLLGYLQDNKKQLTSPEFTDKTNGKTALLKALLNLKNGKNDTIDVLLDIAEKTGDLENLVNASYTDDFYKGQTALHVAIERRSLDHVKLLVQKGADVQAKANGKFFQPKAKHGFYFGELPLSLAVSTNQPDIVSFLIEEGEADVADQDSHGNTVLHILVVMADNTAENTEMFAAMYDKILILHHKLKKQTEDHLEEIKNNQDLTPLKLAAKLGKIGLLKHMLHREFMDEDTRPLSRKFTEWVYGPVHSSLYDISSIDTDEQNSVLEIIIFGSKIPNRREMLQIEPLRSLLEDKWSTFASKLFLINFLLYLIYLIIFTTVAVYRKDGQPPFPLEVPIDYLRCVGEIISVLGAVRFFYQSITFFQRNRPNFKALFTDGFIDLLFLLQASLLLVSALLYLTGRREYVGLLVLSLALAWMNVLYYSRGFKQLGMYFVMMQRMILGDLLHFLFVYGVFLFGFSAAIVALIDEPPLTQHNATNASLANGQSFAEDPFKAEELSYHDMRFTTLELFKFTIGMGDIQFTDHVQYKEVFYILLICYIVLTYILLLNMLIALMGNTVERISTQSENIWNLQRAFTILDIERSLPKCLRKKIYSKARKEQDECQGLFRVEEKNWTQWRSDLGVKRKEDPQFVDPSGSHWNLLNRIYPKRRQTQPSGSSRINGNINLSKLLPV